MSSILSKFRRVSLDTTSKIVLGNDLTTLSTSPKTVVRLEHSQYKILEEKLPRINPSVTDPVQAGVQLGIQLVLKELRNGFTING